MWRQKQPALKAEPLGIGASLPVRTTEHAGGVRSEDKPLIPPREDKHGPPTLLGYFGLTRQPFGVSPDPSFLYLGHTHREALASLVYGIEAGLGFLTLVAKPGMGKTTLLFSLLESCRSAARSAFLFQTQCTSREFMQFIMSELGQQCSGQDFIHMHEEFNKYLVREARAGRRVIIVIDEAQNLDGSVLETIRLLSNFETAHAKLLQIVLSGQPELADKLASRNMVQLRQRVSLVSRLQPLSSDEVKEYIEHRLRVSGYGAEPLFTSDALRILTEFAQGIPRNINNFCFNALSLAFASQSKVVDTSIAEEVIRDLDVSPDLPDVGHDEAVKGWTGDFARLPAAPAVSKQRIESHEAPQKRMPNSNGQGAQCNSPNECEMTRNPDSDGRDPCRGDDTKNQVITPPDGEERFVAALESSAHTINGAKGKVGSDAIEGTDPTSNSAARKRANGDLQASQYFRARNERRGALENATAEDILSTKKHPTNERQPQTLAESLAYISQLTRSLKATRS